MDPAVLAAGAMASLGIALGFPNPFFSLPLLVLLYPAGLAALALGATTWRQALLRGIGAAFPGHVAACYWLCVPLSQVGEIPLPGAIPLALLVCAAMSTQAGLFCVAARKLWRPGSAASALAAGLVWYFLEYGYAVFAGFPWLPLSGALAMAPWSVQLSDTIGATLSGGLWAAAAIALTGFFLTRRKAPAGLALAIVLTFLSYGLYALNASPSIPVLQGEAAISALPENSADPDDFPVLLVEGNIDQNQKWVEAFQISTVRAYTSLSGDAVEKARAALGADAGSYLSRGLILWPETAMPFDLARSPLSYELIGLARTTGMPLLTGAPATEFRPDGGRDTYNRVWLIDTEGRAAGIYDKEHLVPFGEYVPAVFRLSFLETLLQEVGAYTPGTRVGPMRTGRLALGALVCYEAVFPWLAQERVAKGANVLVDASNDAWFGDTSAPWQHLALTTLRSVEQNRWLVRCTNTGLSAVIDARGRVVFRGGQFRADALWARARLETEPSRYHLLFYYLPPACALLLLGLAALLSRKPS